MELLVYSKDRSDLRTNGGSGQGVQLFYMEQLECVKRKKEYLEVCIGPVTTGTGTTLSTEMARPVDNLLWCIFHEC